MNALDKKRALEIEPEKAMDFIAEEQAVLIDLRDALSYSQGHVPGAVHVSPARLLEQLQHFSKEKAILAVCYHGNNSRYAAAFLRKNGFDKAHSLKFGTEGWKERGMPLE